MFVGDVYGKAEEAVELYVSAFEDAGIVEIERFGPDEEESGLKRARFTLAGRDFIAMDSGRQHPFTFTPAMSLVIEFARAEQLDGTFEKLSDGGTILMPLQAYDFSARFAWLNDRYGVSWQLNLVSEDRSH